MPKKLSQHGNKASRNPKSAVVKRKGAVVKRKGAVVKRKQAVVEMDAASTPVYVDETAKRVDAEASSSDATKKYNGSSYNKRVRSTDERPVAELLPALAFLPALDGVQEQFSLECTENLFDLLSEETLLSRAFTGLAVKGTGWTDARWHMLYKSRAAHLKRGRDEARRERLREARRLELEAHRPNFTKLAENAQYGHLPPMFSLFDITQQPQLPMNWKNFVLYE